jgi:transposase
MQTESLFISEENLESLRAGFVAREHAFAEKLRILEQENAWLHEQLRELKRARFGAKSERWESEEQMKMTFNEVEVEAAKSEDSTAQVQSEDTDATAVSSYRRKSRGHRKALPAHLPREVIKVELPVEEQRTESGEPLKVVGWDVSEKLKYEPAKMSVIEYRRAKYGVDSGDYEKTAPPVPSIIPKGIATPELLAAIITGKFADGLTLYRLEEIFTRMNVDLGRGTMARWMVQVAQGLMPIRNVLSDHLYQSYAIACDETSMQVLKEKGREPEAKSWMIVRMNPVEAKKVVLFDYSISRSGETMKDLFADYKGRLLCDGLETYSVLESEMTRYGCNMHARRKFESAAIDGAKAGKSIAAQVMEIYKKIYDLEEELANSPPAEKIEARGKYQRPFFMQINELCQKHRNQVPNKSKLGIAIRYFENEYEYLTRYLDDGHLGPDNGMVERTIRKFAIGRNNWLFADTPQGADASALLYSLVITAKVNGVNPYTALTQILTQVPSAKSIEDYERLADLILAP